MHGPATDVFLSYKAEDRARLSPLVAALEHEGFSVWWDARIGAGTNWHEDIEQHLDAARCVVVAWSKRSLGHDGHFVRDEARQALKRGVYVPVCIDPVEPPLGFREVQALSLKGWRGDRADPRFEAVAAAIRRHVSGERAARQSDFQSTGSRVSRRAAIAGGTGVAVAAAAGGLWAIFGRESARALNSIAVLPFANLSGDPAQAYFSDGLAEELRSALARISGLKVIARTSSETVRDVDAKTAAGKLGVGSIVIGSVRRSPTMIRVGAQLVDGRDGSERWSQVYDRPSGDVLQIQSDIAKRVADALSVQLGHPSDDINVGGTTDPKAHDLFLQAEAVEQKAQNSRDGQRAMELYGAAIQVDPNYALAYARKATALTNVTGSEGAATEWERGFTEAEALGRRAIALAPNFPAGHSALAFVRWYRLDFPGALAEFRKAVSLPGMDGESLGNYVFFLGGLGFIDEALKLADELIGLDPLNPRAYNSKARVLFYARRYEESVTQARIALKLVPNREASLGLIADDLLLLGRVDEAKAVLSRLPDNLYSLTNKAIAAQRSGQHKVSAHILGEVERRFGLTGSYQLAEIHAQRGEAAAAFDSLDQAVLVRDPGLGSLPTDPFLDPIRKEHRFAALLSRLNFPAH